MKTNNIEKFSWANNTCWSLYSPKTGKKIAAVTRTTHNDGAISLHLNCDFLFLEDVAHYIAMLQEATK